MKRFHNAFSLFFTLLGRGKRKMTTTYNGGAAPDNTAETMEEQMARQEESYRRQAIVESKGDVGLMTSIQQDALFEYCINTEDPGPGDLYYDISVRTCYPPMSVEKVLKQFYKYRFHQLVWDCIADGEETGHESDVIASFQHVYGGHIISI